MPESAPIVRRDFPLGSFQLVQIDAAPGAVYEIGPGRDSVVIGDEPYVSIHFLGADAYARS
jgi:hypothetical protein